MMNRTQLASDIAVQKHKGFAKRGDHVEPGTSWWKASLGQEGKPGKKSVQMAWQSPLLNAPFSFKKAKKPPVPKLTQERRAFVKDLEDHGVAKIKRVD